MNFGSYLWHGLKHRCNPIVFTVHCCSSCIFCSLQIGFRSILDAEIGKHIASFTTWPYAVGFTLYHTPTHRQTHKPQKIHKKAHKITITQTHNTQTKKKTHKITSTQPHTHTKYTNTHTHINIHSHTHKKYTATHTHPPPPEPPP